MLRLFDKKDTEDFSEKYRYQSLLKEILEICENIQRDIEENGIHPQTMVGPIIQRIDSVTKELLLAIEGADSDKEEISVVDVSGRIVALLSEKELMSFTELLDALKVAKTTLSRHLTRLIDEGKVERIETDRTVLYKLKTSESSDTNSTLNGG